MATGKALLDVEMPSRVNQVALMSGPEGVFVVAACNDGSLPVLAVEDNDEESRKATQVVSRNLALIEMRTRASRHLLRGNRLTTDKYQPFK